MKVPSFIAFIAVVTTVYSLLNYYFIRKYGKVVKLKGLAAILSRSALSVLILAPAANVFFSRIGPLALAPVSGFVGYSWLAFLFLFLSIHGTADIILFLSTKIGFSRAGKLGKAIFRATLIINIFILSFGIHQARRIETERLVIQTDKLPSQTAKITVLQISDVHFSPVIGVETALRLRRLILKENPDIIVSTGDLIDRGVGRPEEIAAILRSLPAPLGKYAATGNHEFYTGIKESREFTEQAGFKMLRNQAVSPGNLLNIAGVDDTAAERFGASNGISERRSLSRLNRGLYTILLKHRPIVDQNNLKFFDLQLSGHTHGGQIFPFNIPAKLAFPYFSGLYELDEQTKIYVSRGAGTWGPPFRFAASPEIAVIELINANNQH